MCILQQNQRYYTILKIIAKSFYITIEAPILASRLILHIALLGVDSICSIQARKLFNYSKNLFIYFRKL